MKYVTLLLIFISFAVNAQKTSITIDTTQQAAHQQQFFSGKYIFPNGDAKMISMMEGQLYLNPFFGVPVILEKIDSTSYISPEKKLKVNFKNDNNEIIIEDLFEGNKLVGKKIFFEEVTPYELVINGEPLKASALYHEINYYSIKEVVKFLQTKGEEFQYEMPMKAISFFQTALKLDPHNKKLMNSLAALYLRFMHQLHTSDTIYQQHLRQIEEKLKVDN